MKNYHNLLVLQKKHLLELENSYKAHSPLLLLSLFTVLNTSYALWSIFILTGSGDK